VLRGEDVLNEDEKKGFVIINEMVLGDCMQCHITDANALGTSGKFSNNGLDKIVDPMDYKDKGLGNVTGKPTDNGKFKIPSLRNLGFTAPYMHDGRFKTLEEVLHFYNEGVNSSVNIDTKMEHAHNGGVHLDRIQTRQVIAFLQTMNDSSFVTNPAFGNPFLKE
jgi:cytochrome c peroxidase